VVTGLIGDDQVVAVAQLLELVVIGGRAHRLQLADELAVERVNLVCGVGACSERRGRADRERNSIVGQQLGVECGVRCLVPPARNAGGVEEGGVGSRADDREGLRRLP
jgi:hypothetical protein